MIAAVSENNVIGKNNSLPWHLPDDMKYFMQTTKGHFVIMGRKNYQSIPEKFRPLPNRTNLVVSSQKNFDAPGCLIFHSLEDAIQEAKNQNQQEIFLIGGSRIYQDGLVVSGKLYLTHVHAQVDGDVYFPKVNWEQWTEISRVHHPKDDRHAFSFDFVVYLRKN
jgi:dihydrofolate reductase